MSAKVIKLLECVPCGYQWYPKSPDKKPICCPKCRRADWETGHGPRSIAAAKRRIATAEKSKAN